MILNSFSFQAIRIAFKKHPDVTTDIVPPPTTETAILK
jgi:hypothetical protein